MSADKYPSIFLRQMKAIVYILNESYLKLTDAIMSSQLLEFERFSRYGFVGLR